MTIEELKKERVKRSITQAQMASAINVSTRQYIKYEQGIVVPKRVILDRLEAFVKGEHNSYSTDGVREKLVHTNDRVNLIPYYPDINASAGLSFLTDNSNLRIEMINIPNVDATAFINVFGDSMYPKFCSGEIIGIKEIDKDYVMFGQAYVIQMKNGEAYLKYIKQGKDDNHWMLANENKHYEPKEFHISKIEKIFIVKAVITKTTL